MGYGLSIFRDANIVLSFEIELLKNQRIETA